MSVSYFFSVFSEPLAHHWEMDGHGTDGKMHDVSILRIIHCETFLGQTNINMTTATRTLTSATKASTTRTITNMQQQQH